MLSIAFTISIIIVIKIWSYSTLRQPTTDLSSTYDTMPPNPHMEVFHSTFPHLWKTLQEDTWKIGTRHSCIILYIQMYQISEILQVHLIQFDVSFYTLTSSRNYANIRRVGFFRINCWQGECRLFSWEVIPLTLYLNFNISWEICNV